MEYQIDLSVRQTANLVSLCENYRNNGLAWEGAKKILRLIDRNDNRKLLTLLRNHETRTVYKEDEIKFRDEIDFLIKFYSLLELAILTGYIAQPLPATLQQEIKIILGNANMRRYYTDFYPLLLPQLLLNATENGKIQEPVGDPMSFVKLLLLDKFIDDDVENFLWLLDEGDFDSFDLSAFKEILKNREQITLILEGETEKKKVTESVFWGFLKYADYIERFGDLLKRYEGNSLLTSALWNFHGYWFARIHKSLRASFKSCINTLEKTSIDAINSTVIKSGSKAALLIDELVEQKIRIHDAINFTTDPEHGKALKKYFEFNSKPNTIIFAWDSNFIQSAIYGNGLLESIRGLTQDKRYAGMLSYLGKNYPNLALAGYNIDRFYDIEPIFNLVFKNIESSGFVMFHFSEIEISILTVHKMQQRLSVFLTTINRAEDAENPVGIIISKSHEVRYALPSGKNQKLLPEYLEDLTKDDEFAEALAGD